MAFWYVNWGDKSMFLRKWELIRIAVSSTCDYSVLLTTYQKGSAHNDCFVRALYSWEYCYHSLVKKNYYYFWVKMAVCISASHFAPS